MWFIFFTDFNDIHKSQEKSIFHDFQTAEMKESMAKSASVFNESRLFDKGALIPDLRAVGVSEVWMGESA